MLEVILSIMLFWGSVSSSRNLIILCVSSAKRNNSKKEDKIRGDLEGTLEGALEGDLEETSFNSEFESEISIFEKDTSPHVVSVHEGLECVKNESAETTIYRGEKFEDIASKSPTSDSVGCRNTISDGETPNIILPLIKVFIGKSAFLWGIFLLFYLQKDIDFVRLFVLYVLYLSAFTAFEAYKYVKNNRNHAMK